MIAALFLPGVVDSGALTLLKRPRVSALVGDWIGFSTHGHFLRLELDGDGNGYLSVQDPGADEVDTQRVRNWSLSTESPWLISLKIERIASDSDRFTAARISEVSEDTLELKWKYEGVDYPMKATLHKEHGVRILSERSKSAIKAAKRKKT